MTAERDDAQEEDYFEIGGQGRGWLTRSPEGHTCWFGRGPSGNLLGPYRNSENCSGAIQKDIDDYFANLQEESNFSPPSVEQDLAMTLKRETSLSEDDEYPVLEVISIEENGHPQGSPFIVFSPDDVEEEHQFNTPADASNQAIDLKRARERKI